MPSLCRRVLLVVLALLVGAACDAPREGADAVTAAADAAFADAAAGDAAADVAGGVADSGAGTTADTAADAGPLLAADIAVRTDTAVDTGAEVPPDSRADGPPDAADDAPADVPAPDVPPPPTAVLGLPLREDGVLYAGAAAVDITPDPAAGPVYLAGFGHDRVAEGVHDPLWARAIVLSRDREYVAVVALDLVGLTSYRAAVAAERLAADGFAPERLVTHALHNHSSPDSVGLWGPSRAVSGLDPAYQERLAAAIDQAVREAAAAARPATVRVAGARTGAVSPYFTSPRFGGKAPDDTAQVGLIRDSRDPVVVDDRVTALGLFAADTGAAIATVVHVNTHMEVAGGSPLLTSDFAHAARERLEARFGGVGVVWVGTVGGLQTPLGVALPATDADGAVLWQACDEAAVADPADAACHGRATGDLRRDADGDPLPRWSGDDRWERVDTYGRLLGRLAADALEAAPEDRDPRLEVRTAPLYPPLENRFLEIAGLVQDPALLDPIQAAVEELYPDYLDLVLELKAAFAAAVLDFPQDWLVTDARCPLAGTPRVPGCLRDRLWALRIGALHVLTVPGELVPELAVGLPAEAAAEVAAAPPRGPDGRWFRQHDEDCDAVPWGQCRDEVAVGDCDCRRYHATPYALGPDAAAAPPLLDHLDGEHRIILGLAGEMGGYILPPDDYLRIPTRPLSAIVSLGIADFVEYAQDTGDHYEESVSVGPSMASEIQRVATELLAAEPLAD